MFIVPHYICPQLINANAIKMEIQNKSAGRLIKLIISGFCIGLIATIGACKKDNIKKEYPQGSNEQINTWILDSLSRYYYWAAELPKKPGLGQSPVAFFSSVKNASDRFSQLYLPNQAGVSSSRSLYGFDYAVIQEPLSQQFLGLVKCVLKGSPAERYGLKRGSYIRKINGKIFSSSNVVALDQELLTGRTTKLTLTELKDGGYIDQPELNMIAGLTFEQPVLHQVIERGGLKIGYVYIDGFSAGMASTLVSVFSGFKSAGVSELVIDLRYNSGGEISEAAGLCAMVAPGLTYNTDFIIYKGNKNGGQRKESIGEAATFDKRLDFNALLQNNLSLSRVFILATGATASAAEVVINNLKPFTKVKVIGEKTVGKDEASFLISDQRIPKQVDWEMYPIIYKLFNAQGQGGYAGGISPDLELSEFTLLPLVPFGNANDALLSKALDQISAQKVNAGLRSSINEARSVSQIGRILSDSHLAKATQSIVLTHR